MIISIAELTDSGWVGGSVRFEGKLFAFRWKRTTGISVINDFGATFSAARDINDNGKLVGILSAEPGVNRGFVWSPTPGLVLLDANGTSSEVGGINDAGLIVGRDSGGHPDGGVIWDLTGAGTFLSGPPNSSAVAISENGHVLGSAGVGGQGGFTMLWQARH